MGVRLLNPDLWQPWNGGEKFMEFAFLNATLRSPNFPPYDPYFAGGILNYYYYGFYLVGLAHQAHRHRGRSGVQPGRAGPVCAHGVGVVQRWVEPGDGAAGEEEQRSGGARRTLRGSQGVRSTLDAASLGPLCCAGGGLAVLLALLMGNLRGLGWLAGVWRSLVSGRSLPEFDYWAASRVIPNTINEFPLWTFVFADLHPHMIAMPFGLLVVGLALNWVAVRDQGSGRSGIRDQSREDESAQSWRESLSPCLPVYSSPWPSARWARSTRGICRRTRCWSRAHSSSRGGGRGAGWARQAACCWRP